VDEGLETTSLAGRSPTLYKGISKVNHQVLAEFHMKNKLPIFITCLGLLASCNPITQENNTTATQDEWSCINTFDDFLYQMVKIDRNDERYNPPTAHPSSPWEFNAEIPESALGSDWTNMELARTYFEQTELWIRSHENIIKYNVETKDFSIISNSPFDKSGEFYEDVEVRNLFLTAAGKITGVNEPKNYKTVWQKKIPLLSVYNEVENRFEFYDMGLEYREEQVGFGSVGMIPRDGVIIAQSCGLIWIYQQQDGLYSYNPESSELQHYETSFDGVIQRMVASKEGYLLFSQKKEESWEISPGELVKYYPASQTIENIKVPFPHWPDYGTLLYTDSGDLWIGIHGYRSKDGSWVLKSPNRSDYIHLGASSESYNWGQPTLLLQSSNGYLWYTNETGEALGVNGSAWYDPVSEQGCWFTTESGNIVEDDQKNLWLAIDKKIYKYALPK
jgi:hypothetical protein